MLIFVTQQRNLSALRDLSLTENTIYDIADEEEDIEAASQSQDAKSESVAANYTLRKVSVYKNTFSSELSHIKLFKNVIQSLRALRELIVPSNGFSSHQVSQALIEYLKQAKSKG